MESIEGPVTVIHETSAVPTFLLKLVNLLADDSNHEYVDWNESGTSFIVKDQVQFSKFVLPKYFKHNKFASFVRQLNMYGFRKITSLTQSGLKFEKEEVEFYHCMFIRGQEFLLERIKRKVNKPDETTRHQSEDIVKVLAEVEKMKGHQENMDAKLIDLKQENEDLWREVVTLRQKHSHQQKVVNKLLQFLVNLVQQHGSGLKRKLPLMIEDGLSEHSFIPQSKYSKQILMDAGDKAPPQLDSPTVSFPASVRPTYKENALPPTTDSGPSIVEVIENPSAVEDAPLQDAPVATKEGAHLHRNFSDPDFDMSEYINPNSLPFENPAMSGKSLASLDTESDGSAAYSSSDEQQNELERYVPPDQKLSPAMLRDLNTHVDKVQQNLSDLFNNNQVQLDYGLIQELFSSSPDIMPPAGIDPAQHGDVVGNELILHSGASGTAQQDLENIL